MEGALVDEQEDFDAACWAQQEFDERRRREDEAIARCRPLAEQFKRDCAEWEQESIAWNKRILQESHRAKSQ
jgi:hypothetical protein